MFLEPSYSRLPRGGITAHGRATHRYRLRALRRHSLSCAWLIKVGRPLSASFCLFLPLLPLSFHAMWLTPSHLLVALAVVSCLSRATTIDISLIHTSKLQGTIATAANGANATMALFRTAVNIIATSATQPNIGDVLIINSGEAVGLTPYFQIDQGATMRNFMNDIGYDVVGLGSSELFYGPEFLYQWLQGATFDMVCSNLYTAGPLASVIKPYAVRSITTGTGQRIRVGFVGYAAENTCETCTCGTGAIAVIFRPIISSLTAALLRMKADVGVPDVVIALSTSDLQTSQLVTSSADIASLGMPISIVLAGAEQTLFGQQFIQSNTLATGGQAIVALELPLFATAGLITAIMSNDSFGYYSVIDWSQSLQVPVLPCPVNPPTFVSALNATQNKNLACLSADPAYQSIINNLATAISAQSGVVIGYTNQTIAGDNAHCRLVSDGT